MGYKVIKGDGNLICTANQLIDNKKCYVKVIFGSNEGNMINEFVDSINKIKCKEKTNPKIFAFNRRDFMSFILSRAIKYRGSNDPIMPLNRWQIEDVKEKFGNFNDEYLMFKYFELDFIPYKQYTLSELMSDNAIIKEFLMVQSSKIFNLSAIVSRLTDVTYSDNSAPKIVVSLEVEPIVEKLEEFKETFKYLKNESDETLLFYMKNNFAFSRLLAVSICKLEEEQVEENAS